MASVFGHAVSAIAVKSLIFPKKVKRRIIILAGFCSILPDVDVIGFHFGVEYGHWLGHRRFSHSVLFAIITGFILTVLFFREYNANKIIFWRLFFLFSLVTASHGIFDAMTSGGLGIAFFAPFDNARYFFSFRPIQVSPIEIGSFFSEWGMRVLLSEFIWIGLPSIFLLAAVKTTRKLIKRR